MSLNNEALERVKEIVTFHRVATEYHYKEYGAPELKGRLNALNDVLLAIEETEEEFTTKIQNKRRKICCIN